MHDVGFDRAVTLTTRELVAAGMTRSQIAWAVGNGRLIRIRVGHFCLPELDLPSRQAIRVGGRLACVSELRRLGVWVTHPPEVPHVHVAAHASRLRDPHDRRRRLDPDRRAVLHWGELREPPRPGRVSTLDAVRQASECLPLAEAVATLDSAVRLGLVRRADVVRGTASGFGRLLDPRAESGLESLVRFELQSLGLQVEPQVVVAGVGRVDLMVEGAVVVETDGREFHSGVVALRDRRRDALVAARGLTPLRYDYAQVVFERSDVVRAVIGAVLAHRNVRRSGRSRAIAAARRWAAGSS